MHIFNRLELLLGPECVEALAKTNVVLFGVGGVGSWCAEGLVRSGVGRLTVVDSDNVCATNINRQLQAVPASVGKPKAEEIARRLRDINPEAKITALRNIYNLETKDSFGLGGYDYVVDAIDSLSSKVDLIMNASASGATVFSALGAANKVDPTRVKVSSIWKSDKCRLGKFVRKRLRKWGFRGDFLCVWSDENDYGKSVSVLPPVSAGANDICDNAGDNSGIPTNKTVNGSAVHVTAVFGFTLSGLVVQDVANKTHQQNTERCGD